MSTRMFTVRLTVFNCGPTVTASPPSLVCISLSEQSPQTSGGRLFHIGQTNSTKRKERSSVDNNDQARKDELKVLTDVEDVLEKSKEVVKGNSLRVAGIEPDWLKTYAEISRHTRDNKEFSLSHYSHEVGPKINAFAGGFFEQKMWRIRVDMKKQCRIRPVVTYEANYIKHPGYWLAFHKAAAEMREEAAYASGDKVDRVN